MDEHTLVFISIELQPFVGHPGIGKVKVVLSQQGANGHEHPVAYWSWKLLPQINKVLHHLRIVWLLSWGSALSGRTCLVGPSALRLIIAHLYGWRGSSTRTTDLLNGALPCNPFSLPFAIVPEVQKGNADALYCATT